MPGGLRRVIVESDGVFPVRGRNFATRIVIFGSPEGIFQGSEGLYGSSEGIFQGSKGH